LYQDENFARNVTKFAVFSRQLKIARGDGGMLDIIAFGRYMVQTLQKLPALKELLLVDDREVYTGQDPQFVLVRLCDEDGSCSSCVELAMGLARKGEIE
jgi:hypothetical protein